MLARSVPLLASAVIPGEPMNVLVTGCMGQIGQVLTRRLRQKYGQYSVIASDVRFPKDLRSKKSEIQPFVHVDVLDYRRMERVAVENGVECIVHLSSILSQKGEKNTKLALDVNIEGVRNVLEIAREHRMRVFIPSTIAVFGTKSEPDLTPEDVVLNPNTIYGVTKVFMEQLGNYYKDRWEVDFRCLRYPGVLSQDEPGGGTTDYGIAMVQAAVNGENDFICPIAADEALPMMHIADCLEATTQLIEADPEKLSRRVYNVTAFSFTPQQLYEEVIKYYPNFRYQCQVNPMFQSVAASWPNTINDNAARADWAWNHGWDLEKTVEWMIKELHHMRFGGTVPPPSKQE